MFNRSEYLKKSLENPHNGVEYLSKIYGHPIFKFFSLGINKKNDEQKLETLKKGCIWLSDYKGMNDPFELFHLLPSEVYEKSSKRKQAIYDELKLEIKFTSFTENMYDNMCMWSYYSNNHFGFCCEYEFLCNDTMKFQNYKPVLYSNESINSNLNMIKDKMKNKIKLLNKELREDEKNTIYDANQVINIYSAIKGVSWNHEKELRFLIDSIDKNGLELELKNMNLKLISINAGIKCTAENKLLLKEIALSLNVNFFEMDMHKNKYKLIRK